MESAEAGEPSRGAGGQRRGAPPDLDARQDRISTQRKPAGPPLPDEGDADRRRGDEEQPPDADPDEE